MWQWTNSMLPEVPEGRHNLAHGACPERSEGEAVGNIAGDDKKAPAGAALRACADECSLLARMLNRRGKAPSLRESLARADNVANRKRNATPFAIPPRAAWVRWAGRDGLRRSDSGMERNDRWGSEAGGRARRMCPLRALGKCVAGPCCRTLCNARIGHTPREQPRHRIANHSSGNARGATGSSRPDNLSHSCAGNVEDCRYDKRGTAIVFHPWGACEKHT